tara:strand:- start:791 stop:1354 length:564 start_codon:yes stop_codon:yes gene_type:complete
MSTLEVNTINEYTSGNGVNIDSFQVKDGGILAATGVPLQVVCYSDVITAGNVISSTSYTDIEQSSGTKLEIKITPKQSDSKILLIGSVQTYTEYAQQVGNIIALRDISGGTSDTQVSQYRFRDEDTPDNYNLNHPLPYNFVDTPNTTSEVTYHFQGKVDNTSGELMWPAANTTSGYSQTFTLWEIGV